MDTKLINIIFGMKLRQARTEAGFSLTDFAKQAGLSASYMTEVEKGRKYPRTDKIVKMAEVLNRGYDELVSITLDSSLADLETTLSSPLVTKFPFDEFGLGMSDLVDLLTREPDKASALLHAILEVGRQYDLKSEDFLKAALRSYQEINENYFEEIEEVADDFVQQHGLQEQWPVSLHALEAIARKEYGFELDDTLLNSTEGLESYRTVFIQGQNPKLLLNTRLSATQRRFSIAREIGYRVMGLKERSIVSSPDEIRSFDQILNDFKASYFAGAINMPKDQVLEDIQAFFDMPTWQPQALEALIEKYDATPEALLYRFCELVPQHFGLKVHFLRVQQRLDVESSDRYQLYKQLNMNRLLTPSGLALHEHFCRRWLLVRLLRELRDKNQSNSSSPTQLVTGVQMSEFLDSRDRFLCFGFARPAALKAGLNDSVILGFRVDPDLAQTMRFATDPSIPFVTINETCERCPLSAEHCADRVAPPTVLNAEKAQEKKRNSLRELVAQLRN